MTRTRLESLADATVVLVLAGLLAAEVQVAYATSITYDEYAMIGASVSDVTRHEHVFIPEHPPLGRFIVGETLVALGVVERSAGEIHELATRQPLVHWGYGERIARFDNPDFKIPFAAPGLDSVTVAARLPLVLFPLLAALVAFLWARDRFGTAGGLVALALVATDPDLLGHGAVAKFDAALATAALAAGFSLDRLARGRGPAWLLALAASLAVALGLKISAVFVVAALAAAALALARSQPDEAPASPGHPFGRGTRRERLRALGLATLTIGAVVLGFLWLLYRGRNPIVAYAHALTTFSPVAGAERQRALDFTGMRSGFVYFPYVFLLKKPLGTLALLALAAFAAVSPRARGRLGAELVLLLPPVVLALATCAFAAPYGSRYLLPAALFLFVAAGRVAPWAGGSKARWALVVLALLGDGVAAFREHPYHASATGALAGPRLLAWRHLDNSNLDWGGGLKALAAWERATSAPPVVLVPYSAEPCRIAPDPRGGPTPVIAYSSCLRLADLDAYGVRAREVRGADVLFQPERGRVYVVSAHVLAQARLFERAAARVDWGGPPPHLVLGGPVLPAEAVGGGCFLVFDTR